MKKEEQIRQKIIRHNNGPMQVIAGPGTGKTRVLIDHTVYLIKKLHVPPREIMIVTYTRKAARELLTRLTDKLDGKLDLSEMYIGTFHHICNMLLQKYGSHNFDTLSDEDCDKISGTEQQGSALFTDEFEQQYQIYKNLWKGVTFRNTPYFKNLFNTPFVINSNNKEPFFYPCWRLAGDIKKTLDQLSQENKLSVLNQESATSVTEDEELLHNIEAMRNIAKRYETLKADGYFSDYEDLIRNVSQLLDNAAACRIIGNAFRYILVDEYQDINKGMEDFIFKLGKENNYNICVFGDDDQSLYEFRGGNVRYLLDFPKKFPKNTVCAKYRLQTNHRSSPSIIRYCNSWMNEEQPDFTDSHWNPDWREQKTNIPGTTAEAVGNNSVFRLAADNTTQWKKKIITFIKNYSKTVKNNQENECSLNQIAFLCQSVKEPLIQELCDELERENIAVYNPRSNRFFERREIKLLLACLLSLFPAVEEEILAETITCPQNPKNKNEICNSYCRTYCLNDRQEFYNYYKECLKELETAFENGNYPELQNWLEQKELHEKQLNSYQRHILLAFIYQIFAFEPFRTWLKNANFTYKIADNYPALRPARNLSIMTNIAKNFELFNPIKKAQPTLSQKEEMLREFFCEYLRLRKTAGVDEYEYDSDYTPENCISFMTIHQAKGLEFPIVIVFPNSNDPSEGANGKGRAANNRQNVFDALHNPESETEPSVPPDFSTQKYYSYRRLYYTAFSRARNLLLVTHITEQTITSTNPFLKKAYKNTPSIASIPAFFKQKPKIDAIQKYNSIQTYSFTTNVQLYRRCPLLYKFVKELGFATIPPWQTMEGKLMHLLLEKINRIAVVSKGKPENLLEITEEKTLNNALHHMQRIYNLYLEYNPTIPQNDNTTGQQTDAIQRALNEYILQRDATNTWANIESCEEPFYKLINKEFIQNYFPKTELPEAEDPYYIKGIPDLIETDGDTLQLLDFKHAALPQHPDCSTEILDYQRQQCLYCLLLQNNAKYKHKKITAARLYFTKEPREERRYYPLSIKPDDLAKTFRLFHETVTKIQKKEFLRQLEEKSDSKCEDCPFSFYCWGMDER